MHPYNTTATDATSTTTRILPEGATAITGFNRPKCGFNEHNYTQGANAVGFEYEDLHKLLFCSRCGDVIKFELR